MHLLLGIPLVRASVTFQTIYTGTDGGYQELGVQHGDVELEAALGEDENSVTDDSWLQYETPARYGINPCGCKTSYQHIHGENSNGVKSATQQRQSYGFIPDFPYLGSCYP